MPCLILPFCLYFWYCTLLYCTLIIKYSRPLVRLSYCLSPDINNISISRIRPRSIDYACWWESSSRSGRTRTNKMHLQLCLSSNFVVQYTNGQQLRLDAAGQYADWLKVWVLWNTQIPKHPIIFVVHRPAKCAVSNQRYLGRVETLLSFLFSA